MKHNAIFISNYGAGKAGVAKLDDQAYNQFTFPNDAEFVKFKKAYADGKLGVMPTPGYSRLVLALCKFYYFYSHLIAFMYFCMVY